MPIVNYNLPSLKRLEYIERDKKYIDEILKRKNFKSKIVNGEKFCNMCKKYVNAYKFGTFLDNKTPKRYLNSVCKSCAPKRTKRWTLKNPEKEKERLKKLNEARIKDRDTIYEAYGNKCACCGEDNPLFLTLDHVNNDGYEIRPRNAKGNSSGEFSGHYYKRIIKAGFPDDLQLLCWNCNCGKHRNRGVCPHKIKTI